MKCPNPECPGTCKIGVEISASITPPDAAEGVEQSAQLICSRFGQGWSLSSVRNAAKFAEVVAALHPAEPAAVPETEPAAEPEPVEPVESDPVPGGPQQSLLNDDD